MAFQHGLQRAHTDTDSVVAEQYVHVHDEESTVNGRTLRWGDMVEVKKGRVVLHVLGGIYPPSGTIALTRKVSGVIEPYG